MIFQNWIQNVATGFGTTAQQAGIIVSLVNLIALGILTLVLSNREQRKLELVCAIEFTGTLLFLFFGWLPAFTGAIMALIFAGLGAMFARNTMGG